MTLPYHYMQLPRQVIIGKGAIEQIPDVIKRLKLRGPALIIAGQKSCEVAGQTVRDLITKTGIDVDTLLVETSTIRDVLMVEERILEWKPQVIFGVGGGTKIDVAKLSSAHQEIPFISVPTTVSHDGIASPLASIRGFGKPYSIMSQAPLAIIADTEVIADTPLRSVVSGCGDVIAKYTAVKDWKLAHDEKQEYYGEYAASLAMMSVKLVTLNAEKIKEGKEEGLRVLLEALISCGVAMSIAGSSRPCSGSEHLFSHALDMLNPSKGMHGAQCGLGTIMIAYLYGANWKRIKQALKQLGAPTTAADLAVSNEDIIKALELAPSIRPDRYTILQKLNMNYAACEKVARATGIIN